MNEGVPSRPSRRQVLRATIALGGAAAAIPALSGTALAGTALSRTARADAALPASARGRVPLDAVADRIAAGVRRPRIPRRRRFSIADFGATADGVTDSTAAIAAAIAAASAHGGGTASVAVNITSLVLDDVVIDGVPQ